MDNIIKFAFTNVSHIFAPNVVEQLLIIALYAHGWLEHDYIKALEIIRGNKRRDQFRYCQGTQRQTTRQAQKASLVTGPSTFASGCPALL